MWIPNQQLKLKMRVKKEKTFRIKTNNQELLIRKQNESDATSWWILLEKPRYRSCNLIRRRKEKERCSGSNKPMNNNPEPPLRAFSILVTYLISEVSSPIVSLGSISYWLARNLRNSQFLKVSWLIIMGIPVTSMSFLSFHSISPLESGVSWKKKIK